MFEGSCWGGGFKGGGTQGGRRARGVGDYESMGPLREGECTHLGRALWQREVEKTGNHCPKP